VFFLQWATLVGANRRSDSAQLIEVIREPKDMPLFTCPIKVHPNFIPRVTPNFFHNNVVGQQHTAAANTSRNTFDIRPSVVSGRNGNFGGGSDESVNVDSYTPHFCGESLPLTVAEVEDLLMLLLQ